MLTSLQEGVNLVMNRPWTPGERLLLPIWALLDELITVVDVADPIPSSWNGDYLRNVYRKLWRRALRGDA